MVLYFIQVQVFLLRKSSFVKSKLLFDKLLLLFSAK